MVTVGRPVGKVGHCDMDVCLDCLDFLAGDSDWSVVVEETCLLVGVADESGGRFTAIC